MSEAHSIILDEAAARRVVLVRAIEEADGKRPLLDLAERDQIEQSVLRGLPGARPAARAAPTRYLVERANQLLAAVVRRNPRLAGLEHPSRWHAHLAWLLPLLAFVSGLLIDRIGDPHKLDLLSPPLLMFIAWNVAVYVLLALSLVPAGPQSGWSEKAVRWLATLPSQIGGLAGVGMRESLLARFRVHWWRAAGRIESLRLQQVLHIAAAAWAVGVALSIAGGGFVREYRVGWESLWLDAEGVCAVLNFLFAPVLWLLPVEGFSVEELRRLHSDSGVPVDREQARKWVVLYLGLLFLVVVLPRTILAAWAARRSQALLRRVTIALDEPYFAGILSRMNPAVTVGLVGAPTSMEEVVRAVLQQASRTPGDVVQGTAQSILLRTSHDDELCAVAATERADVEQAWLCVATTEELTAALPLLLAIGKPVLVLHARAVDGNALATIARDAGLTADVLAIESAASCWAVEVPLWDALLRRLPPHKLERGQRLVNELKEVQQARLRESMRAMGHALVLSAREAQAMDSDPSWRPKLLTNESRERARKAREEAMANVLVRVNSHMAAALQELRRLHGLPEALDGERLDGPVLDQAYAELMHPPNAAVAGAAAGMAAGALAGAKIDLLTGGMTMGAGAAVGALIGGTGAFSAARWFGEADIRLSDEQLRALAGRMVVHYLAAIHARRMEPEAAQAAPGRWRDSTQAVFEAEVRRHEKLWQQARKMGGDEEAVAAVARALRSATFKVLGRLYDLRGLPMELEKD
ncbi:MAG: DUF3482 domain-containing protein [Ramlibacter sp.]